LKMRPALVRSVAETFEKFLCEKFFRKIGP
jgi:hypothetical protein